jgi:hypothetical protein
MNAAPQTVLEVARLVSNQFGGNAELIWRDRIAHEVNAEIPEVER